MCSRSAERQSLVVLHLLRPRVLWCAGHLRWFFFLLLLLILHLRHLYNCPKYYLGLGCALIPPRRRIFGSARCLCSAERQSLVVLISYVRGLFDAQFTSSFQSLHSASFILPRVTFAHTIPLHYTSRVAPFYLGLGCVLFLPQVMGIGWRYGKKKRCCPRGQHLGCYVNAAQTAVYYNWGPAATRLLPSSFPVNLAKFLTKRPARSCALVFQSSALA